jgi:signal transduction histidine kinase
VTGLDDWAELDVDSSSGEHTDGYFRRQLSHLFDWIVHRSHPTKAYGAITGVRIAKFTTVVAHGELTSEEIELDIARQTASFRGAAELPSLTVTENEIFVPLVGKGELYGYLRYWGVFDSGVRRTIEWRLQPLLDELSHHNYARRVQVLARPFGEVVNGGDLVIQQSDAEKLITQLAALSFGADGAVMRRYDHESKALIVAHFEGDVEAALLGERREGEMVTGALMAPGTHNWSVVEISRDPIIKGHAVDRSAIDRLAGAGIRALVSCSLLDPLGPTNTLIGTLTYFFMRHNKFSWRDIALFLGFCRRAADVLALARETELLRQRNHLLEVQSHIFTQAEVAHLLVHDLGHKVFHVGERAEELVETTRKQLKAYRGHYPAEIERASEALAFDVTILQKEVGDLKAIGRVSDPGGTDFETTTFDLRELVNEVFESMKAPLSKNKIEPRIELPSGVRVRGKKKVLRHVLLNLLLNTIDAARIRKSGRPMTVHMSASQDGDRVKMRFWDTGTGVDQSTFPNPTEIFKIGMSSKKDGTGLGLPMARNLLTRYFNGSLDLIDPKSALFEISIQKESE